MKRTMKTIPNPFRVGMFMYRDRYGSLWAKRNDEPFTRHDCRRFYRELCEIHRTREVTQ
jgi:hypothetical protein